MDYSTTETHIHILGLKGSYVFGILMFVICPVDLIFLKYAVWSWFLWYCCTIGLIFLFVITSYDQISSCKAISTCISAPAVMKNYGKKNSKTRIYLQYKTLYVWKVGYILFTILSVPKYKITFEIQFVPNYKITF